MAFMSKKERNKAPTHINIGDLVEVNVHSEGFRGKKGIVVDIRQIDDDWMILFDTGERIFKLYAYKLDVVGRAAGFNNEMAWQQLMEGDDFE